MFVVVRWCIDPEPYALLVLQCMLNDVAECFSDPYGVPETLFHFVCEALEPTRGYDVEVAFGLNPVVSGSPLLSLPLFELDVHTRVR